MPRPIRKYDEMKAVVYEKYGPPNVVAVKDIPTPVARDNEVLVGIAATTVSAGDVRMRAFDVPGNAFVRFMARLFLGIRGPKRKILGMQVAGRVEAAGANVTKFQVGDEIFASTFGTGFGGHAEYKCFPEDSIISLKPSNVSLTEAATYPIPALGALNVLKRANIQSGQKVLIYGASGAVGTFAVQLAKYWGAEVTGVCSESNFELVKSIGCDHLIDYHISDFTQAGEKYDVIFDAVEKLSRRSSKSALTENGVFLNIGSQGKEDVNELTELKDIIEKGALRAVIDRTYPLDKIVEAYQYADTWHKRGNVVITMSSAD